LTPGAWPLSFEVELPFVVTSSYGFPKHDLTAIAAADELARRYRDGTARRLQPDGTIDLAAMEGWAGRRFHIYRVNVDGTAALVQTTEAPAAYRFSVATIFLGAAVFSLSILSAIVRSDGAGNLLALAVLGFIVCFAGVIRANRFDLSWYIRETFGSESDWQQVFGPTKWAPRSMDQLRAVESLADEHGGKALARPHPDGGTEVRTLKHGRLQTHVVAPDGTALLVDRSKPARLHTLGVTAIAIGVGGAIVTTVLYNLMDLGLRIAWDVSIGLLFAGAILRSLVTLENRAKDRARHGWHLVQTKPDDTD
jgi:hypothetical protein